MIDLRPRACLWLLACMALSACRRPVEKVFEVSTDGASRTGLVETARGVLVGNETGFLTLISHEGKSLWRTRLEREISTRPAATADRVIATTRGGEWVSVALSDGQVQWRLAGQPEVITPLVTDGQRVYVVLPDLEVRAIDPANGATLWTQPAPPNAPRRRGLLTPVVVGEVLVLPFPEGGIVALDRSTGARAWRYPLMGAHSVTTDGTTLYGINFEGKIAALGLDGKRKWEQALDRPMPGGITVANAQVYAAAGAEVVALDAATGVRRWSATVPSPAAGVSVAGDAVVVPLAEPGGRVLLFRPPATERVSEFRIDSALRSTPVLAGGNLILLGSDGRVMGYRLNAR